MEPIPLSLRGRADPFDRATFLDADVEPDRPRPHLPGREIIHLVCQGEPTPAHPGPIHAGPIHAAVSALVPLAVRACRRPRPRSWPPAPRRRWACALEPRQHVHDPDFRRPAATTGQRLSGRRGLKMRAEPVIHRSVAVSSLSFR